MNVIETTNAKSQSAIDLLLAGKIDAATAHAVAANVKAIYKGFDAEVAMAKNGQMLNEMRPQWRTRLGVSAPTNA